MPIDTVQPRWLRPADAAAYVGRSPGALRSLVAAGRLPPPSYALGPRSPRFDREAIDALISGRDAADNWETAVAAATHAILTRRKKKTRGRLG